MSRRMVFGLCALVLLAAAPAEAEAPRGPVPNARAAILMARRIWISLYPISAAKVGSEQSWLAGETATRDGDMWEVGPKKQGPGAIGGGLVFRIAADDGRMLGYYNPQ